MTKATLRAAESRLKAAMRVLNVERGDGFIDVACQSFTDGMWKALGAGYDIEPRGSWFLPTNTKRRAVDAVLYRVRVHSARDMR